METVENCFQSDFEPGEKVNGSLIASFKKGGLINYLPRSKSSNMSSAKINQVKAKKEDLSEKRSKSHNQTESKLVNQKMKKTTVLNLIKFIKDFEIKKENLKNCEKIAKDEKKLT